MKHRFSLSPEASQKFKRAILMESAKRGVKLSQQQFFDLWVAADFPIGEPPIVSREIAGNLQEINADGPDLVARRRALQAEQKLMAAAQGIPGSQEGQYRALNNTTLPVSQDIALPSKAKNPDYVIVPCARMRENDWVYIVKRGKFYGPDYRGYTQDTTQAGVYFRADAEAHIAGCKGEEDLFQIEAIPVGFYVPKANLVLSDFTPENHIQHVGPNAPITHSAAGEGTRNDPLDAKP